MWDNLEINLGIIKAGVKQTLSYKYILAEGETMEVEKYGNNYSIKTSCGCSAGSWNPETRELTVSFTPAPVPVHLTREGRHNYISTKTVTVHTIINEERRVFVLQFKANVHD